MLALSCCCCVWNTRGILTALPCLEIGDPAESLHVMPSMRMPLAHEVLQALAAAGEMRVRRCMDEQGMKVAHGIRELRAALGWVGVANGWP